MDIYQVLHGEHEKVAKLFKDIEGTSSSALASRDSLFNELKMALDLHTKAEEQVFYVPLKQNTDSRFETLEAIEEHHVVDLLLKELAGMPNNKEEWMAKLCVLKEEVQHHVDEEENELFPMARTLLDETQAADMASRFEEQKSRLH